MHTSDNDSESPGRSNRQLIAAASQVLIARQMKVQAFKRRQAQQAMQVDVLPPEPIRVEKLPTEVAERNEFDVFCRGIEAEYRKISSQDRGEREQARAAGALQARIKEYLRHYWFNKIYNRRKNMRMLKIEHARVQSKQEEEDDRELRTIAKRVNLNSSSPAASRQVMQVIKGKVYFLKKGQAPQANLKESALQEKEVKHHIRKSMHFNQFQFQQPSVPTKPRISAFQLMSMRRMTQLAQEVRGPDGVVGKSFLEQMRELSQRINSKQHRVIKSISETSSSSSTQSFVQRQRMPQTATQSNRRKPAAFFSNRSTTAPQKSRAPTLHTSPNQSFTTQMQRLMQTCKTVITENTIDARKINFDSVYKPQEPISPEASQPIIQKMSHLYERIESDYRSPNQEIGFDFEEPFGRLDNHLVSRLKENISYLDRERKRKDYFVKRHKQKQIFVPQPFFK